MRDSISEVLEKMFFLTLDFQEAADEHEFLDSYSGDILVSRLDFSGPFSGFFELLIPERLAILMAADFMGSNEDNVSQDQVYDTVKEIINMVAGNTFSNLDRQTPMNLDIPEMVPFDHIHGGYETRDRGEEIFVAVHTLQYPFALKMVTERNRCELLPSP